MLLFWERVAALGVPFYLHPHNPLPTQRRIYEGRGELPGPTWAFAVETGGHALRLITSGLFDRFPSLQVIVGHSGEFLPFALPRREQRMAHIPQVTLAKPATQHLRDNFRITTSGNYHTASLLELGADRLLFAPTSPSRRWRTARPGLTPVPISEADRLKIGRTTAYALLGL